MARDYIRRSADINENVDAENYLARTVHESYELIDIGILDADGKAIMARQKFDPIGFIRWRNET